MSILSRLFKKITYSSRRSRINKFSLFETRKSNVKILGKIYIFGTPKLIFKGRCCIFPNVSFSGNGTITFGDGVDIGKDVSIYSSKDGGVEIGNDVGIAANSYIIDCDHGTNLKNGTPMMKQPLIVEKITIGNDVWIGANSLILMGSTVEDGVVVGANSLVKGHLISNSIYVGSPVKKLKERNNG